jgi:superfamily II DNA or RNA helicase
LIKYLQIYIVLRYLNIRYIDNNILVMRMNKIKTHLTHHGYHIDLDSISKEKEKEIVKELTVIPYRLDATPDDLEKLKFLMYRYSKNRSQIIVPRYYGVNKFGPAKLSTFEPEEIDVKFTKELRDKQIVVTEKCIKYILRHGGGLLSVPCGFGKTVCALYIAYRLGLKTLIIVHKSNLLMQWIERIKEFLGIAADRIGIIKQKICTSDGKDIVVGMIQTVAKRNYKNIYDKFGFVIYDEAHHVACKFFSRALLKTAGQYTMALTATPYRGDGTIKVMYWFLGGTIYREKMKINKNVIVKMIYHKSSDKKLFTLKKKWLKTKGKIVPDTGKMITNICDLDSRNKKIIEMITYIRRTEPVRKILILSGRVEHLELLKLGVDAAIKKDIQWGLIDEDEIMSCLYTGKTKPPARQDAEERGDIIFATSNMAQEGLDIKHLNTIILATDQKDVVQAIGRIMRKILEAGDVRPMIIDFGDDIDVISNWIKIRNMVYSKCKYEIENYYLVDDQFKTSIEYHGMEINDQDVHNKNSYLNRMINDHNIMMNSFKQDIAMFRNMCIDIEQQFNRDGHGQTIKDIMRYPDIEDQQYIVKDRLEYTDLPDILHVPKLTCKDFDQELLKDAENADKINLEEDMEFDNLDIENERSFLQSLKNIRPENVVPKKKLF